MSKLRLIDEGGLAAFLKVYLSSGPYRRLIGNRFFRATVTSVSYTTGGATLVGLQRNGESASDGGSYLSFYPAAVGNDVLCVWTDAANAVVIGNVTGGLGTLPGGSKSVIATQGTFSAETDISGLAATVTVGAGRRIRISVKIGASSSIAADVAEFRIKEGSTQLQSSGIACPNANAGFYTSFWVVLTPPVGAHTYKVTGLRASGTGVITMQAGGTFPAQLEIEDIGV